jgi:predicted nucleic acid-binding protein
MNNQAALGEDRRNQRQCWDLYDRWVDSGSAIFMEEPAGIETGLRQRTESEFASPKTWADAYLAAFAEAAGLTLVTFDRALAAKVQGAVLLG